VATLLEEGVCIIKDKEVAERFLRDLETSQGMGWKEIKYRAERAKKKLEEGEKWLMRMKL